MEVNEMSSFFCIYERILIIINLMSACTKEYAFIFNTLQFLVLRKKSDKKNH